METEIVDYFSSDRQDHWRAKIAESDWRAGQYLHQLLREGRFHALAGVRSRLLLLTSGDELLAFCSFAERDEVDDGGLTPWAGFVYTFPRFRGKRLMGLLLEHVRRLAAAEGYPYVYISTDHVGLYEKYGCIFWKTMRTIHGEESRVYRMDTGSAER